MTHEISKSKKNAEPLSATWKFDLEDTINGDPETTPAELSVMRVYLNFMTDENPCPFCAMSVLMARTGLSEPTVKRARRKLIKLGYMTPEGASSHRGAIRYSIKNPRLDFVRQHIAEREKLYSSRDQILPPREGRKKTKVEGSNFTPNTRDQILPPNTVDTVEGGAPQRDRLSNTNSKLVNNSHALALERARDASEGNKQPSVTDINRMFQEAIEASAENTDRHPNPFDPLMPSDELPIFDGEEPTHHGDYDGPSTGDEVHVGAGAFIKLEVNDIESNEHFDDEENDDYAFTESELKLINSF